MKLFIPVCHSNKFYDIKFLLLITQNIIMSLEKHTSRIK